MMPRFGWSSRKHDSDLIKEQLTDYFSDFSAGDLASEIELSNLEQLDDNLEFYLYLGEIRYQNHEFPSLHAIQIQFEGAALLNFEPLILVNAVDYIARNPRKTKTQMATPVEKRILYIIQMIKYLKNGRCS